MTATRTRKPTATQLATLRFVASGKAYVQNNGQSPQRELRQPTYVALLRAKLIQPNGNVRTVLPNGRSARRVDLTPRGVVALASTL